MHEGAQLPSGPLGGQILTSVEGIAGVVATQRVSSKQLSTHRLPSYRSAPERLTLDLLVLG